MYQSTDSLLAGNRRALARIISQVEDDGPEAHALLAALYPHTGRGHVIGITGAPGTGKSTLVNALAKAYRTDGVTVGVIAVDPTSPFSGGALLGDRLRMRDLAGDPGIFIRSMASRGALGGLARATRDVLRALDAAGFDILLVETVGAGQTEVDIARLAHTVIVVEVPGLGDEVQANKAGLLEIADVLVLNKADRPGAESALRALRASLELGGSHIVMPESSGHHRPEEISAAANVARKQSAVGWKIPLLATIATDGEGIEALADAIEQHAAYLCASGEWQKRERAQLARELDSRLREALLAEAAGRWWNNGAFAEALELLLARRIDPAGAVRWLLERREKK